MFTGGLTPRRSGEESSTVRVPVACLRARDPSTRLTEETMPCDQLPADTVRAAPWSSGRWCCYYHDNARRLLPLPWRRGAELTDAERAEVLPSIQDFQLGEQSEGRHLLRRAAAYAER